ncbi:Cna B-type domain-containing protein [Lachnospiraceae bacterium SGI.066]
MSKKFHSGLKRTLAWMLVVALTVQGCMVVYADDFTSEPDAAVVSEEISDADVDADNDLEVVEDEDTTDDVDISDDSNEDVDSDVTVEEEQADESGINEFSDGSDASVFADGAEAVGDDVNPNVQNGTGTIAGDHKYTYQRILDDKGNYKILAAAYPANGSNMTLNVGDDRKGLFQCYIPKNSNTTTNTLSEFGTSCKKLTYMSASSSSAPCYVTWSVEGGKTDVVALLSASASYDGGEVASVECTSGEVIIRGKGKGEATIVGTLTDKQYGGGMTVKIKVTVNPKEEPVAIDQEFDLEGAPTTYALATAASNKSGSWNLKDSWGDGSQPGANNQNINYRAPEGSEANGFDKVKVSFKGYANPGTVNHTFRLDFYELFGDRSADVNSLSPTSRSGYIRETFYRTIKTPDPGIYLTTAGPVNLVKKGSSSVTGTIKTQVFQVNQESGQSEQVSNPSFTYEFSDPSVAEVTKTSSGQITVKALQAGTTTLTIKYEGLASKTIQINVSGIVITEPNKTINMSLDDEADHQILYKVYNYTKENPDITDADDTDVTWTITDNSIAALNTDGGFRIKKTGTTTIKATTSSGGSSDFDTVTLTVTGAGRLALNSDDAITLKKGDSKKVTATAYYNDSRVTNATINWTTTNEKVATVDNGTIKAVGYGDAQIAASWTAENGKTYTAKVDVKVVYNGLYLSNEQNEVTMSQGSTQEIVWQILDMGEYSKGSTGEGYNSSSDVTWKSSDETVATVDSEGVITAKDLPEDKEETSATITVSYRGTKVKDIQVKVIDNQTIASESTVEVAGTKGEKKTDKDGNDKSNTWRTGSYKNGHGSKDAEFNSNNDNFELANTTESTVSVTGKTPSGGYAYLSHKYYIPLETGQLCGVWEGIAVKVTGAQGLYLDKSSVTLKMGDKETSATTTVQGTYITADGKEWTHWANEDSYATKDLSTVNLVSGDDNVVKVETDPKNGSICHLTAVGPGQTTLTFRFDKTNYTATCDVTVVSDDARVILSPSKLTVAEGGTGALEAKAWDGKQWIENPEITWNTYNANTATIDKDGIVTGVKKGTVAATATWKKDAETSVESNRILITVVPSRNVTITTEWNDHDNQDGIRPEKATLQLTANGEPSGDPVELNAENNWTYEWKQLIAEDEEGTNIVYRVTAEDPEEYTAKVTGSADDGFVVTYSHEIAKINATANVTWDDAENQDGIRPASVSLQLKSKVEGGEAVNVGDNVTVKADADGNWTKTWTDLPKYNAGKVIEYTVEETGLPEGYTITTTKDEETGAITLKNSYTPKGVDIAVSVNWNDAENQDGKRPEFVEAELYAGDTSTGKKVKLTADNEWKATFEKMAVNKNGKPIEYSLVSTKAEGYEIETTGSAIKGLVLNYTHAVETVDVKATVVWADGNNKDGVRPDTVSLQLKADDENLGDVITVNEKSNWTKTWTGLDKYKAGKKVTYKIEVVGLKGGEDGYTAEITEDAGTGFTITATHVPAVAEIKASVNWDDAKNQDAIRPELVEAELYADDVSTGKKVKLTADNKWTASFGEMNLKKNGKTIDYTLVTTKVDGYDCIVEGIPAKGLVLKFTHKTETVDVTLTTKWNDKENQDGNRPTSYSVQLMADGVKVGDLITLNAGNEFSKTWTGLQKNRTGKVGEAIVYTAEATVPNPDLYETSVSGDAATGLVVTNTYVPATVEIPVSVKWDDAENQDGARLDSVEAELYADGVATENKVTLNAGNNWTAKFAKVDVKKDGTRIKYEVKSTEKEGYTVSVSGNILEDEGLTLTYKHVPATVNVSAAAAWNDANNQDGIRPTDTLVQLYANGSELGDKAVIESDKSWTKTWENLPKYKEGKEIEYTVIAYAVSGYTVKVTGNAAEGFKAEYTHNVQKIKITVKNTWSDLDNVVDSRPAKLVVEIYANGKATGRSVTLTASNKWTAAVTNLNKNAAGKAISYTGKVVGAPKGYSISIKAANGTVNVTSKYTTFTKKLKLKLSKTSYVYTGKNLKPTVTVYNGNKKVSSKYYTVTYKNNKNTGYATVIVKGKVKGKFAKYAGKATFTIKPKTMKNPVVKKGAKKTLNVSWRRDAQATKYVVQYSQSSKFKGRTTKTVTINNNKTGKTVLKGLTSGKNYYVRVRSCKVVNGKEIWGAYSKATKMKVK